MERLVWTTPTIETLKNFQGLPFKGSDTSWVNLFLLRRKYNIWEIARQLKSTYKTAANLPGTVVQLAKTRDLETNGGMIYLVHEDAKVVEDDLQTLRLIERKFFKLLVNDGMSRRWVPFDGGSPTDFKALLKDCDTHGAILIAADNTQEIEGAQCITPKTIGEAHKGFDCVVIGYEQSLLELREKETACLELLFDTMELVREGGRVIIPRSTYRYLSYGRQGAEQLMLVKGLALEHVSASQTDAVIGVRQREKSDFTWHHQQAWKERLV